MVVDEMSQACLPQIDNEYDPCKSDYDCAADLDLSCFSDSLCHDIGSVSLDYTCNSVNDCGAGYYCYRDMEGDECQPVLEYGAECSLDQRDPCGPETICWETDGSGIGTCTRSVDICQADRAFDIIQQLLGRY